MNRNELMRILKRELVHLILKSKNPKRIVSLQRDLNNLLDLQKKILKNPGLFNE